MSAIKSKILKKWDKAALGVRICCIKFVQRVIHVQTTGPIADPRVSSTPWTARVRTPWLTRSVQRPEKNEISLAMVPRNHPLIPPPNLEAEASGLLDRMLNVFHESTGYGQIDLTPRTMKYPLLTEHLTGMPCSSMRR